MLGRTRRAPPAAGQGARPLLSVFVMDTSWDELTLAFSHTSMFPFFDIAHYLVSLMALKHQPGECGVPQAGSSGTPRRGRPSCARRRDP